LQQESKARPCLAQQAFICGGLPMCSAQNFPVWERQAICSSRLGPDSALAAAHPDRKTSATNTASLMDCTFRQHDSFIRTAAISPEAALAVWHRASAAMIDRSSQGRASNREIDEMLNKAGWLGAGLTLTVLASISLGASPAEAAVYCKTAGVPEGCVARPTTAAAGAPGRVGVAGVGAGAQGAGVRAGTPTDRGGPVDRAGRR
jgi:hypothetical protein